jgi:hypothetical protein
MTGSLSSGPKLAKALIRADDQKRPNPPGRPVDLIDRAGPQGRQGGGRAYGGGILGGLPLPNAQPSSVPGFGL